jgi:hypothetical protein
MKGKIAHKKLTQQHREVYYENAIQDLIDGKINPEYVNYRWQKLKDIREK